VVRCFEDSNVVHVNGGVDPLRDIEVINTELMLADLDTVEKRYKKVEKVAQSSKDAKVRAEYNISKKLYDALKEGKPARSVPVDEDEVQILRELQLLSVKPVLYVCNVAEAEYLEGKSALADKVADYAKAEGNASLSICSAMEAEISQLDDPNERKEFLESLGVKEPGLHRLIRTSYALLDLITYFTAGEKEVRAWTIRRGTKAPGAAGVIHTDFERGFIRAETYACEDLFKYKSETAVKEAGRYRSEGKDYVVQDGDIMLFRFNV
jgi:GTP-binding protein YchF